MIKTKALHSTSLCYASKLHKSFWNDLFKIENNQIIALKCKMIDSQILKNFIKDLRDYSKIHGWKYFRSAKFNFAGCDKIQKRGFKALNHFLQKYLLSVRQLKLNFDINLNVTDEVLQQFSVHLKYLQNLRQINLSFASCRRITNKGILALQSRIAKKQKNLRELALNFATCPQLGSKGLLSLSSNLIPRISNLSKLNLDLSDSQDINTKFMNYFGRGINKHAASLVSLNLNLAGYLCLQIDDNAIQALSNQINQSLCQLKHLSLHFYRCSKMTDKSLQVLGQWIAQKAVCLEKLELNFSLCPLFTDEGAIYLLKEISHNLQELQFLKLSFPLCEKITNKAFVAFGFEEGHNFTDLQRLKIDFSSCYKITDEGLLQLLPLLSVNMKNLKEVAIHASRLSPKIKKSFAEKLNFIPTLNFYE